MQNLIDMQLGVMPARLHQVAFGNVAIGPIGVSKITSAKRPIRSYLSLAAAIVIVLLIGGSVGHQFGGADQMSIVQATPDGLKAGVELARALSETDSGVPAATPIGSVLINLSFKSRFGEYCRGFEIDRKTGVSEGVACNSPDGWIVKSLTTDGHSNAMSGYQAASGPDDSMTETAIDQLGVITILDHSDETKAIKNAWR
ncbi:MAG: hypothetical protein POG74_12115 [Acidocella sp.]|nr:hypothetical protein [Acidocella sp.]